jgi:hypothetical protein
MTDSMSDAVVRYDVVDGVAWLTINRPRVTRVPSGSPHRATRFTPVDICHSRRDDFLPAADEAKG